MAEIMVYMTNQEVVEILAEWARRKYPSEFSGKALCFDGLYGNSVVIRPEGMSGMFYPKPTPEAPRAKPEPLPAPNPLPAAKKREWTPEQRAAAGERMRKAREAKAAKKLPNPEPEVPSLGEAGAPLSDLPGGAD